MKKVSIRVVRAIVATLLVVCTMAACTQNNPHTQDRYVVLSPEIAEILSALSLTNRIVGRTAECDYPEGLKDVEIVGNFGQVSLERIVALNPSIVFTTALVQNEITAQLNKLGIPTMQLYPQSPAQLIDIIEQLGTVCDVERQARDVIEYIRGGLLDNGNHSGTRNTPRIYVEIYHDPIMSADNTSYLGHLLVLAGYENIFPSLVRDYARVNPEEVVRLNPDVILLTYPGVTAEDIANRKGWNEINAVRNQKIFTATDIDPDLILRATPRNVEGVNRLREFNE